MRPRWSAQNRGQHLMPDDYPISVKWLWIKPHFGMLYVIDVDGVEAATALHLKALPFRQQRVITSLQD